MTALKPKLNPRKAAPVKNAGAPQAAAAPGASPTRGASARARASESSESETAPPAPVRDGTPKTASHSSRPFPIVGIGASAGGLEAFTQLLQSLPTDTGMGFVLVQHLDPQHESALTLLLARATRMPVREATNNLRIKRNHVYIIPPNVDLGIARGVLKLQPRPPGRAPHRSVDFFFEALAQDQGERCIGVILSGTASDGTAGLEAIKAEAGITFAQDDSAKYDSMPRSAIAAGVVDFILSPEKIAKELALIAKHPYVANGGELQPEAEREADQRDGPEAPLASGGSGIPRTGAKRARAEAKGEAAQGRAWHGTRMPDGTVALPADGFKKILLLLRNHSGVDFSLYKSSTIQRRVTRRLVLSKKSTLAEYAALLKGNATELDALYSDVLISVTSFFRNPEAFEVLKVKVFPRIIQKQPQRQPDEPVRIWTLGCSTGQEAYSIAMAYAEFAGKSVRAPRLQIFATDLNDALLSKARHGLYAKSLVQDVSPERLRRFFVEEEGGYRINKPLRDSVVFARQNVLSDPPFSRMDLISCRNLLIYIEPSLQKQILPSFHYALKPGGFLFLGSSESVGAFTNLFEPVDGRQKIFSKRVATSAAYHLPASQQLRVVPRGTGTGEPPERVRGASRSTLEPEGFRGELNAQREADRVMVNQFAPPSVLIDAGMEILQFRGPTSAFLQPPTGRASLNILKMAREGLMLPLRAAINKAKKEKKPVRRENVRVNGNGQARTVHLEVIPLRNLKERCFLVLFEVAGAAAPESHPSRKSPGTNRTDRTQGAPTKRTAELERELAETRDYLQSIEEQHEAANEELQASTEELQSANEEHQSVNEELETSKEELESTNEELTTVNDEMASRNAELSLANADLKNLHVSIHTAILVLGRDLTIRRFTPLAQRAFNLLATDVGRSLNGIRHNLVFPESESDDRGAHAPRVSVESPRLDGPEGRGASKDPRARALADPRGARVLPTNLEDLVREVIGSGTVRECEVRDKEGRWHGLRVRPYLTLENKVDGAVLVLTDIDALKRSEQEARHARDYAEATLRTAPYPLLVLRADLRVNTANDAFYTTFKVSPVATEGALIYELGNGQWNIPQLRRLLEDILPRNSFFNDFEVTHEFPTLGPRTMLLNARRLDDEEGAPQQILLSIGDITERMQSQAAVRASEIRFRRLFEAAQDGVLLMDSVSRKITDANPFMTKLLGYTREEFLGRELWEIGLLKDEAASHAAFRGLQNEGFIRYEDLPLKTKEGRAIDVEAVCNLYDEDGRKIIQCNIRDITARKQAEEALRVSEEKYRTFVSATSDVVYKMSADWREMRNLQGKEFVVTTDEARGNWEKSYIPETELPLVRATIEKAIQTKSIFELEHRVIRLDGSIGWTCSRAIPVLDGQGEIVEWLGTASDVTERKLAEEKLREQKATLDFTLESAQVGDWDLDLIHDTSRRSLRHDQCFGYDQPIPDKDWSIKVFFQHVHPEDRPRVERQFQEAVSQLQDWHFECRVVWPDQSVHWIEAHGSIYRTEEGKATRMLGIVANITERKEAEQGLREAKDRLANQAAELERTVGERTAALRETVGELEAFSYSIAHDMRAPLRSMQSFANILAQECSDQISASGKDYIRRIITSADRMDRLIQDVLNYSRIVRTTLPLSRVDVQKLLGGIVESYPHLQPAHAEILLEGSFPHVLAHEAALTQCISNLLGNAVKFVAPGVPARVRVWAETRDHRVRLFFEDNGVGIKAEAHEKIFEMFQRLDPNFDGTGIGLAIVKKAIERMGGSVGLESEPGRGSRFWLDLTPAPMEGE